MEGTDRNLLDDREARWLVVGGSVIGLAAFAVPALLSGTILDNYWDWGNGKGLSAFITPSFVLGILGIPAGVYYAGKRELRDEPGQRRAARIGGYALAGIFLGVSLGTAVSFASILGFLVLLLVLALLGVT